MKGKHHSRLREFLEDAHGNFNAFTVTALLAGITLATSPAVCRYLEWPVLTRDEISALSLVYCISALGDYLLGIYLKKLPSLTMNLSDDASVTGPVGANQNLEQGAPQ
jgi:hypothetical protein